MGQRTSDHEECSTSSVDSVGICQGVCSCVSCLMNREYTVYVTSTRFCTVHTTRTRFIFKIGLVLSAAVSRSTTHLQIIIITISLHISLCDAKSVQLFFLSRILRSCCIPVAWLLFDSVRIISLRQAQFFFCQFFFLRSLDAKLFKSKQKPMRTYGSRNKNAQKQSPKCTIAIQKPSNCPSRQHGCRKSDESHALLVSDYAKCFRNEWAKSNALKRTNIL